MLRSLDQKLLDSILQQYGGNIPNLNLSNNGLKDVTNIVQLSHCLLKLNFSGNEIANVAPIVKLIRLKELCLADNNIESLIAWQGTVLPALHTLDLSGNKIHSLQALLLPLVPPGGRPRPYTAADGTALVNVLPSLRVLRLAGNPVVVGVPGYHLELFKHHPQLAVIDNWERNKVTPSAEGTGIAFPPAAVNQPAIEAAPKSKYDPKINDPEEKIRSLQKQLDAMQEAFQLQEQSLGANGEALATSSRKLTSQRLLRANAQGKDAVPPSPAAVAVAAAEEKEERQVIEQFPYYRLLQLWRKSAQESIVARLFAEQRLAQLAAERKKERSSQARSLHEQEVQALAWKQRFAAAQEQNNYLQQQQSLLQQQLAEHIAREATSEGESVAARGVVDHLAHFLHHAKIAVDNYFSRLELQVAEAMEHMQLQQQRLHTAEDRLQFLSAMLAQREVEVRNRMAAVDAERKLLQWSSQIALQQPTGDAGASLTPHDAAAAAAAPQLKQMQTGRSAAAAPPATLDAEAEGLLRTVFRNLDPSDSGFVAVKLLLDCLLAQFEMHDAEAAQTHAVQQQLFESFASGEQMLLHELNLRNRSGRGADQLLTALGNVLSRGLGADRLLSVLKVLLRLDIDADLTWGEFLMHLIPSPDYSSCSASTRQSQSLTAQERRELQQAGLMGDLHWGLVPLAADADALAGAVGSTSGSTSSGSSSRIAGSSSAAGRVGATGKAACAYSSADAERLARERRFLLRRLQESERTLERRAEGIKSYFVNSMRREQLKQERMQQQLQQSQEEVTTLTERLRETTAMLHSIKERQQQRIAELEQNNEELSATLRGRQRDDAVRYEHMLQQEASKLSRLETEYNLLQRDAGKKEVKCRALQRDLLRVQAGQAAQVTELEQLQQALQAAQQRLGQEKAAEAQRRGEAEAVFERERSLLAGRVAELQATLIEANEKVLRMEQEAAAAATAKQTIGTNTDQQSAPQHAADDKVSQTAAPVEALQQQINEFRRAYAQQVAAGPSPADKISGAAEPAAVNVAGGSQLMSAHLAKLLRLAEQAIGDDRGGV